MKKTLFVLILALCACGKKNDDGSSTPTTPDPGKATLSAPASNSTCTTGKVISPTQSSILFTWSAATNSESYDIVVKNLLSGATVTQNTTATQLEITLSRNTPYSWYVISKTSKSITTAQSDLYKFYNSGIASTFYAPFPADITSPTMGQSINSTAGKVTLSWTATDVDNDIVGYDVYMGTSASSLTAIKTNSPVNSYDVTVTSGTTYYWRIVTRDGQGNTSTSDIYQFAVN